MADINKRNVTSIARAPEGTGSKALSDLSKMFGDRAAAERQKVKDKLALDTSNKRYNQQEQRLDAQEIESARRFGIQQDRLAANDKESLRRFNIEKDIRQSEADYKTNERNAKKVYGEAIADGFLDNIKYKMEQHPEFIKSRLDVRKNNLINGKKSLLAFVGSDHSEEALNRAMSDFSSGLGNSEEDKKSIAFRRNSYKELANELRFVKTPKEREALIASISDKMYDSKIRDLNSDIESGKYLLAGEKQTAALSMLPRESLQYLNIDNIRENLGKSLGGTTRKELMDRERTAVSDKNKLATLGYGKGTVNKHKATPKDYDALAEFDASLNIGFKDNAKAKKSIAIMKEKNIHPSAILSTVKSNLDKGFFDTSFEVNPDDKEGFGNMVSNARSLSEKFNNSGSRLGTPKITSDKTVEQIRLLTLGKYKAGKLADYIPENNRQTELDLSKLPQFGPEDGTDENRSAITIRSIKSTDSYSDVPGSDYMPTATEALAERARHEEFNSFPSVVGRFADDVEYVSGRYLPAASGIGKVGSAGIKTASNMLEKISGARRSLDKVQKPTVKSITKTKPKISVTPGSNGKPKIKVVSESGKPRLRVENPKVFNSTAEKFLHLWKSYTGK